MKKLAILAFALVVCAAVSANAADAKENWTKHCAKCHGEDGKGGTAMGKKLGVKDYTDAAVQEKMKDEEMIKATKEGVKDAEGSYQVPEWGRLGDGQGDFVFFEAVPRPTPAEHSRLIRYATSIGGAQRELRNGRRNSAADQLESCAHSERGWEWSYLRKLADTVRSTYDRLYRTFLALHRRTRTLHTHQTAPPGPNPPPGRAGG